MNNRFKDELAAEEALLKSENQEDKIDELKSPSFFKNLFVENNESKTKAVDMLPFLLFLAGMTMLYIANSHLAVGNVRQIDKLSKEVKELGWEYKSLKADLMFKSKMTEVAKKVDTLGIKELIEPPKKLVVKY